MNNGGRGYNQQPYNVGYMPQGYPVRGRGMPPQSYGYYPQNMEAPVATRAQILAALKFLYTVTLDREWEVERIPFPKRGPRRLPQVPNRDQLLALFRALKSPKYRALLMSCYAAGLRIIEACRLRVEDIDSNQMVLRVHRGKGNKDRLTLLSPRLLDALRCYWRIDKPQDWMFPGRRPEGHISPDTVRQVFAKARQQAGLGRWCTPHTLRSALA